MVISPRYLMMKFETNKDTTFVRGDQVEARRGYMMVARTMMKQLEVIILKTLKGWDRQRERRVDRGRSHIDD